MAARTKFPTTVRREDKDALIIIGAFVVRIMPICETVKKNATSDSYYDCWKYDFTCQLAQTSISVTLSGFQSWFVNGEKYAGPILEEVLRNAKKGRGKFPFQCADSQDCKSGKKCCPHDSYDSQMIITDHNKFTFDVDLFTLKRWKKGDPILPLLQPALKGNAKVEIDLTFICQGKEMHGTCE